MPSDAEVTIRGITIGFPGDWTKAEMIRSLLNEPESFSISEISKAIPAAYSQVAGVARSIESTGPAPKAPKPKIEPPSAAWGMSPTTGKPLKKKPGTTSFKPNPKVGKLRTTGLPSDVAIGECANCAYSLVIRRGGPQLQLIHTGMSAEEYLAVVQFCQPVPAVLLQ